MGQLFAFPYLRYPLPFSFLFSIGKADSDRCSITLITLSTPYTYTCRVCGRKKIAKEAFEKDDEWCRMMFGEYLPELGELIPEVWKCVFCGGGWIRKIESRDIH